MGSMTLFLRINYLHKSTESFSMSSMASSFIMLIADHIIVIKVLRDIVFRTNFMKTL